MLLLIRWEKNISIWVQNSLASNTLNNEMLYLVWISLVKIASSFMKDFLFKQKAGTK